MDSRKILNESEAQVLRKKLNAYRVQRDKVWEGQGFGKQVSATAIMGAAILLLVLIFDTSFRELVLRTWSTNPEFVIIGLGVFITSVLVLAVRSSLTFGYAIPRSDNKYQRKKFKRETGYTPEEASKLLDPVAGPSAIELQVAANIRGH